MKKLVALFSVGVLIAMMVGCGLNPAGPASISVDIPAFNSVAISGGWFPVTITIESDSEITSVVPKVKKGTLDVTSSFSFNLNATDYLGKESVSLQMGIQTTSASAGTDYTLEVTVTAGSIEKTGTQSFTVTGGTALSINTSVTIGSFGSATGSSVELDGPTVMTSGTATAAGSGADIVGTYSSYNDYRVFNPYYAKNSSSIAAFAGWVSPNRTLFHKVTGVTFSSVNTKETIAAQFNAASATADMLTCAAGDVLVVRTDQTHYALIQITSFDQSTSGTAVLAIKE